MYLLYYRARSHTKMYTEYRIVQHKELFSFSLHGAFPWTLFVFPVQEKGSGYYMSHVSRDIWFIPGEGSVKGFGEL